jgi:hypothetical protein
MCPFGQLVVLPEAIIDEKVSVSPINIGDGDHVLQTGQYTSIDLIFANVLHPLLYSHSTRWAIFPTKHKKG